MKTTKVEKYSICSSCKVTIADLATLVDLDEMVDSTTDSTIAIEVIESPDHYVVQIYSLVPSGSSCDYCDDEE